MKIRNGFVSNSSSCSFTINLEKVSQLQYFKIRNKIETLAEIDKSHDREQTWRMSLNDYDYTLCVSADMDDDFQMEDFLMTEIGISEIESKY